MAQVFSRGRMRLYLLKLLEEKPRHGYEILQLIQQQLGGAYAPSPGSVYPRLRKLESGGLVVHTERGGRKVYELTTAGVAEIELRADELASLEQDIQDSARLGTTRREDPPDEALPEPLRPAGEPHRPRRRAMRFTSRWPEAPEFSGPAGMVETQLQVFEARVRALLAQSSPQVDDVVDCAAVLDDAYHRIAEILEDAE